MELVVTLLVIAILAVVILPRFADKTTFDTRGFTDQARAALQFARKVAVASGRNVCVASTSASLTLTMAAARGAATACSVPVIDPSSGAAYTLPTPTSVSLSVIALTFRADGSASATTTLDVIGDVTNTITVEGGTGHVH